MKNRIHVTFNTPEAADKLFEILQDKERMEELLDMEIEEVFPKPHVQIEGFNHVHELHSISISIKE
jgi:hypothetical protein